MADTRQLEPIQGSQTPTFLCWPPAASTLGGEFADLAAAAGLALDPWQRLVLDVGLGRTELGRWACFECGLVVPRQNGKGSVFEALELGWLFLMRERLVVHTAHEFKTCADGFRRVLELVENNDWLRKRVAKVNHAHGEEGIKTTAGAELRFMARTSGSGRGFTGDKVVLDEAYALTPAHMAALLPTLSSVDDPQLWYGSSAGMESSVMLRGVRDRGRTGDDPRLGYLEWCALLTDDPDDIASAAKANPALGRRISVEYIENERRSLALTSPTEYRRERLGIWDDESGAAGVIDLEAWAALLDDESRIVGPKTFAVDVTPDRAWTTVAVAGRRADKLDHVELVKHQAGTRWAAPLLAELVRLWRSGPVVLDPASPAGSLIADLDELGVPVATVNGREYAQACGAFFDAVMPPPPGAAPAELATSLDQAWPGPVTEPTAAAPAAHAPTVRHIGQAPLTAAVAAARRRQIGEAWGWGRRHTDAVISPLVAATLALHGHRSRAEPDYDLLDSFY